MADDREHRIRTRAHSIWEREGRPHGRDQDHWHQASLEEGDVPPSGDVPDPSGRSLGSAAQSDLIPEDAGQGVGRAGSLVDTGPAIGLVAGSPGAGGTGGGSAGLGSLSLGPDVGHGAGTGPGEGAGEPGGMSSIGSGTAAAGAGSAGTGSGGLASGLRPGGPASGSPARK